MQTLLLAEVNDLMKHAKKLFGLMFSGSGSLRAFGKILPRLHKKSLFWSIFSDRFFRCRIRVGILFCPDVAWILKGVWK